MGGWVRGWVVGEGRGGGGGLMGMGTWLGGWGVREGGGGGGVILVVIRTIKEENKLKTAAL